MQLLTYILTFKVYSLAKLQSVLWYVSNMISQSYMALWIITYLSPILDIVIFKFQLVIEAPGILWWLTLIAQLKICTENTFYQENDLAWRIIHVKMQYLFHDTIVL